MMQKTWIGVLLFGTLAGGCATHSLPDGFESELVRGGGCGDVFLWGGSEAKDIGLGFTAIGFAEAAHEDGVEQTTVLDLASGEAELLVIMGDFITEGYCIDVPLPEDTVVLSLLATEGKATLTVTPNEEGSGGAPFSAEARVLLEDVAFENGKNNRTELETFTLEGTVGWFAG